MKKNKCKRTNTLLLSAKTLLFCAIFFSLKTYAQQQDVFNASYIKSMMLKTAAWQFDHDNGKPENTWTNATFYAGVYAAYETTKEAALFDSLMQVGERNSWLPAKRYDHADDIAITQTYIDLFRITKEKKFIQASLDSIEKLKKQPGNEVAKHVITWWWCDALFMAPPTLAKLSKSLHDPSYLILSDTLYRQCYRLLYNQEEMLFARDATYLINSAGQGKFEANGKKMFWSRGNGWVMAGLVRLLDEMPKNYAGRGFYVELYKTMADRLLTLQQTDGLWRTSLLDPGAYPGGEASGSGFNCYALAWGLNNKILDKGKFLPAVKSSWQALNTLITAEGKVGWVQPIGADPRRNFNAESWESFGTGAYLLAGSQIIKLKNK